MLAQASVAKEGEFTALPKMSKDWWAGAGCPCKRGLLLAYSNSPTADNSKASPHPLAIS